MPAPSFRGNEKNSQLDSLTAETLDPEQLDGETSLLLYPNATLNLKSRGVSGCRYELPQAEGLVPDARLCRLPYREYYWAVTRAGHGKKPLLSIHTLYQRKTSWPASSESTLASRPANKYRRTSDADLQRPAGRNEDDRVTPRVRKTYRPAEPIAINPLLLVDASSLDTTTAQTLSPDSSDDEDPIRSPSPTPAPSVSSPPPPSPVLSEIGMDDDMQEQAAAVAQQQQQQQQAQAAQAVALLLQQQQAQAAQAAAQAAALLLQQQGPVQLFNIAAAAAAPAVPAVANQVFAFPSKDDLVAYRPACMTRNPYLKVPVPQPPPPTDEAGNAPYQQLDVTLPIHYIPTQRAARHWAASYTDSFTGKVGHHIVGVLANGGNHVRNTTFETPLVDQIRTALRVRAPTGMMEIKFPVPASIDGAHVGTDKYGGPISVSILLESDAGAAAILAQGTYGVHTSLRFWVQGYRPTDSEWVVAQHDLIGSTDDPTDIEAWARAGLIDTAFHNADTYRELDQATQALGGPGPQRVFDALNTIHAQFLPHATTPVVVYYMEPVSTVPEVQERVSRALRKLEYTSGEYGFRPRSRGNASECMLCKSAQQPTFLCPYADKNVTAGASGWWGPPAQLSELPTDHPLYPADGGNNNDGSSGRGGRGLG
ncbi:hypothetical protein C8F01DRAFT_1360527 [Mycena amicta]|nr:hypothetical protein C8F01DRAFT_1360527 [Mycena amicta]